MKMKKINELEVGDKVFIHHKYSKEIDIVERLTKTQVILKKFYFKFTRESGHQIKGNTVIEHATKDDIARFEKEKRRIALSYNLKSVKFEKMTLEQLEQIDKIVFDSIGD